MSVLQIRTEHITKDYPGTRALDDINLTYEGGKVHALVGKNGSGKSTFVKILAGAVQPTMGELYLNDEQVKFNSTSDAYKKGIVSVYQEMSLVPGLTVAENIFLGRLPKKNNVIDWPRIYQRADELLKIMKSEIDPNEKVSRLSMWQMQVVEITKALSFDPKVIMLDEPTSALAQNEIENLYEAVTALRDHGVIIIYITHKLQELPEIADTVSVLRDGKLIGKREMAETSHKEIVQMMFGDVKIRTRPKELEAQEDTILEVQGLTREGLFEDINFKLKRGEVLGIAGMLGSGRTELLRGIFGADPIDGGKVIIEDKVFTTTNPIKMIETGIGLTPENRKEDGLILIHSVRDNLNYASMRLVANGWLENKQQKNALAKKQVEELEIVVSDMDAACLSLSGGNQQKVVLGNWLNTKPKVMLYDEPSRGIDVNAKRQIFEIIWQQASRGVSSIFVSTELEELIDVCHRILVMREGKMIDELDPEDVTVNQLYEICMGGTQE